MRIEFFEKPTCQVFAVRNDTFSRKREENIETAIGRIDRGTLQQERVPFRNGKMKLAQIDVGRNLAANETFGFQSSARNTRLPLVPPKPKEFDSTTFNFILRAEFGT